ncbi:hypothetical protein PO909_029716 [Leuciscus waleckii]
MRGPEVRTPSSGPVTQGVAWSIGTSDAPGDGPCPVERPLWAACSSPFCASTLDAASLRGKQAASTSGDSDGPSETNVRHGGGGRGRVGRFGPVGNTLSPVFEPTSAPRLPARKAPFPVTASTQRPPTPSAPRGGGFRTRTPPMSGRAVFEPPPGGPSGARPVCRKPASSRFSFQRALTWLILPVAYACLKD